MQLEFEQQKLMQVWVAGRPYAQERPRFVNGKVLSSTSKGLKDWRGRLRSAIRAATRELSLKELEGPLCVDLVLLMPVKDRGRWWQLCHTKPDKDNLEKAVLDVMEGAGIFAKGDSQVAAGEVVKVWCPPGHEGALVKLSRIRVKNAPHEAGQVVCGELDWLA